MSELIKLLRDYSEGPSGYWKKVCDEAADRIEALEKHLTTGYDLVAESIGDQQYDYRARASSYVDSSIKLLSPTTGDK